MNENRENNEMIQLWRKWRGALDCDYTATLWSADEMRCLSEIFNGELKTAGLKEGDIVAVALANTVAFPVVLMSLLAMGCNPLLIHAAAPVSELNRIAREFEVHYVIHDFIEGVSRIKMEQVNQVLINFAVKNMTIRLITLKKEQKDSDGSNKYRLSREGIILHPTSGTYGVSKYCLRSQAAALAEAENYTKSIEIYKKITITVTTPLHHAFAYGFGLAAALLTDSTLRLYPVYNPRKLLKKIKEDPGDILAVVPPMLGSLVQMTKESSNRIPRYVFYAGAPCSESLALKFQALFNTELYQVYGTTETGAICTDYSIEGRGQGVGKPLHNVEIKLTGRELYSELKKGAGEVRVKSTSMMQGYTHGSAHCSGFRPTGDIGYPDKKGNLHLIGRSKDIINVGGSKVDPGEVEKVLLDHPRVTDAVVYPGCFDGVKEVVQAAVTINGNRVDIKELSEFCYKNLTSYKLPVIFHILVEIPRSPSGKCLKTRLPGFPRHLAASSLQRT